MSLENSPKRKFKSIASTSRWILSRVSDSMSVRSRTSSVMQKLQKEVIGSSDGDHLHVGFRLRDWGLALAEFCLAYSWNSFLGRETLEKTLHLRNLTPRDDMIQRLFWLGCSSLGTLIVGQLMDCYTGYYLMAVINVSIHFTLASLFFINEIISDSLSEDEYGLLLSHIFLWSFIPIKACGFSRFVYALDQLSVRNSRIVLNFAFIIVLASKLGGFAFSMTVDSGASLHVLAFIAFAFNSTVFYMYYYVLVPRRRFQFGQKRRVEVRLWSCIVTAILTRRRLKGRIKRRSWLDYAEVKYDKSVIAKTKKIVQLFTMIVPMAGFLVFVESQKIIFDPFWSNLRLAGRNTSRHMIVFVKSSSILAMIVAEFIMIPILKSRNVQVTFIKRFVFGYIAVLFAIGYASVIVTFTQKFFSGPSIGMIRVHNTLSSHSAKVSAVEPSFTEISFVIPSNNSRKANFEVHDERLFQVEISFNERRVVTHFSIAPRMEICYLLVEPEEVIRVPGYLPIWEAPPGNNSKGMPRMFVVNFIRRRSQFLRLKNLDTNQKTTIEVSSGKSRVFQVIEGRYSVRMIGFHRILSYDFLIGGVYGIYLYQDLHDFAIDIDTILPENTAPALLGLGIAFPMGVAEGIAMVALHTFVFMIAPDGLKGIAMSFMYFVKHLTAWVLLIGFYTWHPFITANSLTIYTFLGMGFFFLSAVLLLKFKRLYKM